MRQQTLSAHLSRAKGRVRAVGWAGTTHSAGFGGISLGEGSLDLSAQRGAGFAIPRCSRLVPPSLSPTEQPVLQHQGLVNARGCFWFLFWKALL